MSTPSSETPHPTEPARIQCDPAVVIGRALKATTSLRGVVAFPTQDESKNAQDAMQHALALVDAFVILAGDMAASMQRTAAANEAMAHLMSIDLNETIAEGIRAGLEPAVNDAVKENAKRSFIGQKVD